MDTMWTTYLLVVSLGLVASFPTEEQILPLLQELQKLVNKIKRQEADVPLDASRTQQVHLGTQGQDKSLYDARLAAWNSQWDEPPPSPGLTNVCETFCPKWCRKDARRECHFACTNLCDKKLRNSNPFIGNPNYEVVYSDFNFDLHDLNKDKYITKREFALSEMVPKQEVDHVFTFVDANGDGYIDRREYQGGPLLFTVQMAAELSAMPDGMPTKKPKTQA